MNICIVGAGAIGGWVAVKLAVAGEPVMALTSSGALDRIELSEAGVARTAELSQFDGPAELLIIAVKATALPTAARSAKTLVGPDTLILPMLNGGPWGVVDGMQLRSIDPDGMLAAA